MWWFEILLGILSCWGVYAGLRCETRKVALRRTVWIIASTTIVLQIAALLICYLKLPVQFRGNGVFTLAGQDLGIANYTLTIRLLGGGWISSLKGLGWLVGMQGVAPLAAIWLGVGLHYLEKLALDIYYGARTVSPF